MSGLVSCYSQALKKRFVCSRNKQVFLRSRENYFTSFTMSWDSALGTPGNCSWKDSHIPISAQEWQIQCSPHACFQPADLPLFAGGRASLLHFILCCRNWGTNVIAQSVMLSYFEASFLIDSRQNGEVVICLCHSSLSSPSCGFAPPPPSPFCQ